MVLMLRLQGYIYAVLIVPFVDIFFHFLDAEGFTYARSVVIISLRDHLGCKNKELSAKDFRTLCPCSATTALMARLRRVEGTFSSATFKSSDI